jgi:hypothetical protein
MAGQVNPNCNLRVYAQPDCTGNQILNFPFTDGTLECLIPDFGGE